MQPVHHPEAFHTLLALGIVIVVSLSGIITFAFGKRLNRALPYLVGAASGALLGTACAHLIPEAIQKTGSGHKLSLLLAAGFLGFFLLERVLHIFFQGETSEPATATQIGRESFHHGHEQDKESGKPLVANILLGGAIHSFMDGIAIATGFLVAHEAGVATTIAVLLHEVPHTVADVGVLIYGGLSRMKAVWLNLLATSSSLVGGCFVLLVGEHTNAVTSILLPITAANFIYIALAILMPGLQNERDGWRSLKQVGCLIGGLALMFALTGSAHD